MRGVSQFCAVFRLDDTKYLPQRQMKFREKVQYIPAKKSSSLANPLIELTKMLHKSVSVKSAIESAEKYHGGQSRFHSI
jgi:hypothetical protein